MLSWLFERVAFCLGNVQFSKMIVNGCDVLVSIIFPTFKGDKTFQFMRLYCYVIIFEKLVVVS